MSQVQPFVSNKDPTWNHPACDFQPSNSSAGLLSHSYWHAFHASAAHRRIPYRLIPVPPIRARCARWSTESLQTDCVKTKITFMQRSCAVFNHTSCRLRFLSFEFTIIPIGLKTNTSKALAFSLRDFLLLALKGRTACARSSMEARTGSDALYSCLHCDRLWELGCWMFCNGGCHLNMCSCTHVQVFFSMSATADHGPQTADGLGPRLGRPRGK